MAAKEKSSGKRASGSDKSVPPTKKAGDQARKAQEWSGGSKAAKGPIKPSSKSNPNSTNKS